MPPGAWRRVAPFAGAALLVAALVACTSSAEKSRQQGFCPKGFTVGDAAGMTRFKPGPGRDPTDVQFRAEIVKVESNCEFDKNGADIDTKVTIAVQEGPSALNRSASFGYFVAILDGNKRVVARQEFASEFKFEGNRNRMASLEELSERIPGLTSKDSANYQIVVGLLVTPDELNYNRQRQR
ncbi:MAG: hypothetical protein ABI439_15165 [Rhodospirillales bacterium]